jgi:hypothetical protein
LTISAVQMKQISKCTHGVTHLAHLPEIYLCERLEIPQTLSNLETQKNMCVSM